jgi:hypothetical protein
MRRALHAFAAAAAVAAAMAVAGCSSSPGWLTDAHVAVAGNGATDHDCRAGICKHNENTDLIVWRGDVWLIHRTAESQMLGPNASLHVYRERDGHFVETARIAAPPDRDLRDPHFYVVGDTLRIKALARLPVVSVRDSDVDTVALGSASTDGASWTPLAEIGPHGWSFWRLKQAPLDAGGEWLTAAYEDGDRSVVLYRSADGAQFTRGPLVYGVAADTPLETELQFLPSGRLLALVRTDGTDDELLGQIGRLRTQVCWAEPPYDAFACPQTLDGVRLDGPLTFFWRDRLFSIARKHLGADGRKRTALYEFGGTLDGGPLTIREWGELPSAGDTSYAGAALLPDGRVRATWYAGDLGADDTWFLGMYAATDVWQATLDPARLR